MPTLTVKQDGSAQYTTIATAFAAAVDGDIIEIQDSGTYLENILMTKSGGWTKPVELRGQTGQLPIMDGSTSGANAALRSSGAVNTAYHPIIKNIKFQNYNNGGGALGGVIYLPGVPIEVIDCTFLNCNAPVINTIRGSAGQAAIVLRCKAYGCQKMIFGDTDYVQAINCVSVPDSGNGSIELYGANSYAYHCSVYGTGSITAIGVYTGVITNCIAKQGTSGGTGLRAATINYSCSNGFSTAFNGTQNNCISTDPLYVDVGTNDLSLQSGSPCTNTGTNAGVTTDILNAARPNGAGYDMGAYERILTVSVSGATVLSGTSVRIDLSGSQTTDGTWTTTTNYTVTPTGGGAAVGVTAATPSGNPANSVTLTTSEHTNSSAYTVAVTGVTLIANGSANYTGQGVPPTVASVEQLSVTQIKITFSEPMSPGYGLTTTTSYAVTRQGGAPVVVQSVAAQDVANPTYVILTLASSLLAGSVYTIEVS